MPVVQIFVRLLLLAVILFVLYIYMIMPRIFGRPDQSAFRGALFAHRGFFDTGKGIPENSMPAFRRAVAAGYCIELDVQLSKDGIPVVFHDFTLKRMTGRPGRVCDYTAEELSGFYLDSTSYTIPLFSDVLDLVHGETPLLVEIKSEGTNMEVCRKADALLRSYQGTYCIESFNPLVLLWYRRHHPQILRGQLSDRFLAQPQYRKVRLVLPCLALQNMMLDFLARPDFIAYNCRYGQNISRRLIRRLFGGKSAAYTIKSGRDFKEAKPHFDAFIFDSFDPGRL